MRIAPVPKTGSVVRWSVGSSPIASANPDVAQRLAQAAYIHEVGGSNPSIGTERQVYPPADTRLKG